MIDDTLSQIFAQYEQEYKLVFFCILGINPLQ